jgi:hypothetical protein
MQDNPGPQQNHHKSHGPSQAGKKNIDEVLLKIIMESTTMESFEKGQQGKKNLIASLQRCVHVVAAWIKRATGARHLSHFLIKSLIKC